MRTHVFFLELKSKPTMHKIDQMVSKPAIRPEASFVIFLCTKIFSLVITQGSFSLFYSPVYECSEITPPNEDK